MFPVLHTVNCHTLHTHLHPPPCHSHLSHLAHSPWPTPMSTYSLTLHCTISLCLHPTLILAYLSPSPSPLTNPSPTSPHPPLTHIPSSTPHPPSPSPSPVTPPLTLTSLLHPTSSLHSASQLLPSMWTLCVSVTRPMLFTTSSVTCSTTLSQSMTWGGVP